MNTATIHTETLPSGFTFQMRLIPGGSFDMGSRDTDSQVDSSEKPQRIGVRIDPFYLASYAVTQALYKVIMNDDNHLPNIQNSQHPVEEVSWLHTQVFIKALNKKTRANRDNLGLEKYRLPSEAEWEYAARGGLLNSGYCYAGSDKIKEVGWYKGNSDNEIHEVGLLLPNQLGIYDLSGNVWEWVEDHWYDNYHGAPKDGRSWLTKYTGAPRVLRGGSHASDPQHCNVAYRNSGAPRFRAYGIGFRLALSQIRIGPFSHYMVTSRV